MTFDPIPITGVLSFDYFFSLVFVLGLVAIVPGQILKLLRT